MNQTHPITDPIAPVLDQNITARVTGGYDESMIDKLEGLEGVRFRPAMYIGAPDETGMHHCIFEVVDNSIDQHMAGFCNLITVQLHGDGSVTVADDGRGIPVGVHPAAGIPTVEMVLTTLHAGGKFGQGAYKYSGGLHGVGAKCTNALSEFFVCEVCRDGFIYSIGFSHGKTVSPLVRLGATGKTGTKINFKPDGTIFTCPLDFEWSRVAKRLRELAFLNPGLTIRLADERGAGREQTFNYPDGIRQFVFEISVAKEPVQPRPIAISAVRGEVYVDCVFAYNKGYDENTMCFANAIPNPEGGTHLSGFRSALTRALSQCAAKNQLIKERDLKINGEDVREGLICVLSVKLPNPHFSSQTKTKLIDPEIEGIVSAVIYEKLVALLDLDPKLAGELVAKAVQAARVREAARKTREELRAKPGSRGGLPGKLSDCSEKDPAICELFIVEGDSAGGSAKMGRDRKVQAILPIRGKLINVEKAALERVLANTEIRTLITAIGAGFGEGEDAGAFRPERVRYHKIVIMTDADVDGSHIRVLLLTFFFRKMRQLIDHGYVYCAQPPLFQVLRKKREEYVQSLEELETKLALLGCEDAVLTRQGDGKSFEGATLEELVRGVQRLESHRPAADRAGVPLEALIARFGEAGSIPRFVAKFDGGETRYAASEAALMSSRDETRKVDVRQIHEAASLEDALQTLASLGIAAGQISGDGSPAFSVSYKARTTACTGLSAATALLRDAGREGVKIKRFKGLGEMNASELYKTTMDAAKRHIVQITMNDAAEADRTFSVLMSDQVDQRKLWLRRQAKYVRNLDV